jgi:hypothetical protein
MEEFPEEDKTIVAKVIRRNVVKGMNENYFRYKFFLEKKEILEH